ncbi:hypothetical protein P691DRAFT_777489 [Macrolepiota fuliginosa MF-IS2]|uniref:Nephrocystin 3-like N-terminal domain-containing protein n=1 Tax=Macrolepiota fuliginosa MF-IS2 TaxID=1400762 RepID=A0A9P5X6V8_9AGAR|nr:hypothetical protein P691DRAFT_777489 [Macrolepiota fuliginosa MF-IS2]
MPFLEGSQNTIIIGSNLIDQPTINNISGQTGIDILFEASNRDAAHDSSARDYDPRCHPGTREQHIEDIVYWAVPAAGADDPLPLFWMKGLAGVGKSAIAQTCAEKLKERGKLGAAFFFSRNGRDKAAEFIPTIVYQLATEFPDYRVHVDHRIRNDRAILDKTMAVQFEALVVEPLQELKKSGRGIGKRVAIIVDGLDECNSTDDQRKIIETIAAAARSGITPFCWAFFSRPSPHIEGSFTRTDVTRITLTTVLPISNNADSDIELYLRDGFENILRDRNISVKSQWPSDDDIQTLVKASNGLFVYAATALRVVARAGSLEEALRAVCAVTFNNKHNSPFAELDAFYMLIMQRIPPDVLTTVLLLCNELCTDSSYTSDSQTGVTFCGNAWTLSEIEFQAVCNHLSAVLHVHDYSNPLDFTQFGATNLPFQRLSPAAIRKLRDHIDHRLGGSIYFYHKSFSDFLIDPTRSGPFCVMSSPGPNAYYKHCLSVMLKYEESYSLRGSELELAPDVSDSASSLSWPYTNELVNSALKASVYDWAFGICFRVGSLPEIERQLLERFGHVDFRKARQNEAMVSTKYSGFMVSVRWHCLGYFKMIYRTQLFRTLQDKFRILFDVAKFRVTIKRWEKCGVIEPHYPNLTSRFKSLVPKKSQGNVISGLYRIGHGPKSLFWYWKINLKEEYYQEFWAVDLDEGERVYRDEQFDLWPTKMPWDKDVR